MKRSLYLIVALLLSVVTMQANDYLEQDRHYSTRTGGADCIHFTIPVWAAGAYDYYAVDESYVYFKLTGSDEKVVISHYKSEEYGENDKENGRGSAWMKLENDKGEIVVTSMASGVNQHIPSGDWTEKLIVKQRPDDGYDYVTFLEFDWYPHQDLSDTTFVVGVHSVFERSYTHGNRMEKNFDLGQYKGAGNDMMPQLFTPYLYQVNQSGMTGYGYAAIPYSTFYSTIGYTMSIQDTTFHKNTSRSDNIFIMTADSVQSGFYVDFLEYRNEELGTTMTQRSNKIDIPAYHRIYEFGGTEETDSTLTYTGNIELHWNVKNPDATDLLEDDYFEVQRALKSDFSDAQTIKLVALTKGADKGRYSFLDDSHDTWTGNVDTSGQDTLQANACTKLNDFELRDENDQLMATLDLTLTANKLYSPGIELYYRVRRASSSVWGWDHEFAETMQIGRHNYLAPLAEQQAPYTKDDDFDMNHQVHFSFVLENREVQLELPEPDDCTLSYVVKKEKAENIALEFAAIPLDGDKLRTKVYCTLYDEENNKVRDEWKVEKSQTVEARRGGKLQLRYQNHLADKDTTWINDFLSLDRSCKVTLKESYFNPMLYGYEYYSLECKQEATSGYTNDIDKRVEALSDSLKQMLIAKMQGEVHDLLGRCMWDRTARLVLVRSSEGETDSKIEMIIPQDSIIRQSDGSWLASFSDVADRPCTNYTYAVRIDQSSADLHVQDSAQLQPIALTGPSLYYDDAAAIKSFTATQGLTSTEYKRGVMLVWTPSSNAVDDYVLTRRTDSAAVADTLYNGVEAMFFDQTAVPNVIYQYTVTARYSCNGQYSENSKTVEGWRTPYGEISGHVIMPDNSGMPGVKVELLDLSDSTVVKSVTTNAIGYYRFDSLDYGYLAPVKMTLEYQQGEGCDDPQEHVEMRVENSKGELIQDWTHLDAGEYTFPVGAVLLTKSIYNVYEGHSSVTLTVSGTVLCRNFAVEVGPDLYKKYYEVLFTADSTAQPITSKDFAIIPSDMHAQFSYNYTSASTADITLSVDNAVATGVDFMSTNTVRLTGRALYQLSTVPVAGAMFILNGDTVHRGNVPLTTATDGTFEMALIQGKTYTLQMFKPGHTFLNDGYLEVEEGQKEFALDKALDGVRFYDQTKVRLAGRVAGGNIQRDLPTAFGLGKNNLGDNLMLVLQLEGDNTAQLIHDPDDLSRDTMKNVINQIVYSTDTLSADPERIVGQTSVLIEKKRITIFPDPKTGEYVADLFPTKYKVVQATANGYATLLPSGQGMEIFDLTNAPVTSYDPKIDADSVHYNAVYDRIYHTPVQVHLHQMINGLPKPGYGEEKIELSSLDPNQHTRIALYHQLNTGRIHYVLGYPLFFTNRKYQFTAEAYEVYRYNNSDAQSIDTVPWRGGEVIVRNGMQINSTPQTFPLDENGRNNSIFLDIDNIEVESSGTDALRAISVALNTEGNVVESDQIEGFVIGSTTGVGALESTETDIQLLDIVRDPGGSGSSSWIESGSSYSFSYKTQLNLKVGVNLQPSWGTDVNMHVGLFTGAAPGGGSYSGEPIQAESKFAFDLPIVFEWDNGWDYNYTFSTSDRISTSSKTTTVYVGSNADVFVGASISRVINKVRSVVVINDSLYEMRKPAIEAGAIKVLASGVDNQMNRYHLVTGEVISAGMHVYRTFAYTQYYIMETVIPQMALRRYNLLMNFPDSAAAKAAANAKGEPVYWYHNDAPDQYPEYYSMILPDGDGVFTDKVAAYDNMITSWTALLVANEKEKVEARTKGTLLGTYSVSDGTSYTHTDSYGASMGYNEVPVANALATMSQSMTSGGIGTALMNTVGNAIKNLWNYKSLTQSTVGKTMAQALDDFYNKDGNNKTKKTDQEIGTKSNGWEFHMNYTPVADFNKEIRQSNNGGQSQSHGFTIAPDPMGDLTVSVYRAELDSTWKATAEDVLDATDLKDNADVLYGSYVFYTVAGSTYCPHEEEEYTQFYNPGTVLNSGTLWIHKPELTADAYEKTNIDPSTRATFRIKLANGGQLDTGYATKGASFQLTLDGASNPDGAKVYINGAPLIQSLWYWILPDQPITQTIEVERGTVDDYNLNFIMYVEDCARTRTDMSLGVHFLPESSPVNIAMPRQNWVMNTLSPRDSTGYYIPIEIDGFDLHYKNFDHIEFQYKLSSESEERWVNLCSFYAEDSLYNHASGNKAMIENGRIPAFRFYGERDPMEQRYDLRAVSFCRYGSGFVSKSSPVISGTKDTRPPVVFGEPEPANSILGVGDNLLLRFNELIAGNYLDEDNNFQITGVTNETGMTAATSLHFDGNSSASTKVKRDLTEKSFTIDMMIRPSEPNRTTDMVLFETGNGKITKQLLLTRDNRLRLQSVTANTITGNTSKSIGDILSYVRVLCVYDKAKSNVRFYAGTEDVTDTIFGDTAVTFNVEHSALFRFGTTYEGDMLESRIWTKALTQEEIAATANHTLTGYERELLAYYRMDEGKGETVTDYAHGATLYLDGCSWNRQQGFSLRLSGDSVQLDGNLLGRSAVYDMTIMLWFKAEKSGTLFRSSQQQWSVPDGYADNNWHHWVLTVSRTYNNVALFVDGNMVQTFDATQLGGITGAMYLGGEGFKGHIDEFVIFEQAMPKSLVELFDDVSLAGDEMGLVGYLPFEEQYLNPSGVLQQRFSGNDKRVFKNPETGEVIDKIVPLVISDVTGMEDGENNAPVKSHGLLNKLYFNWSFNNNELMINILNRDYEVNKQSIYVTVRDVEDLNGNPMVSPVTWTAFVDRNSLKWSEKKIEWRMTDEQSEDQDLTVRIINQSGKRHQYTIESLPSWLTVNTEYGALDPLEEQSVRLTFAGQTAVGEYSDIIYLTDENGLSEPLRIEYIVEAVQPYDDIDEGKYPYSMSVCAKVQITMEDGSVYDTDERDIVYALYNNECVGAANVSLNPVSNTTDVYLSVLGNDNMTLKLIHFQLWQASTGKLYDLTASQNVLFSHGLVYGCSDDEPLMLTTSGSQRQQIELNPGWNWASVNLDLTAAKGALGICMSAAKPWTNGDLIKNPKARLFSTYDETTDAFVGTLRELHHSQMYMIYSASGNTMRISGETLSEDAMTVTVRGDGNWSPIPCLFDQRTPLTEALADYYDNASPGDLIKGHNRFATFTSDKRWVGDLQVLQPGEGYLLRRMAPGIVSIHFYKQNQSNVESRKSKAFSDQPSAYSNPQAATNMTMIAKVDNLLSLSASGLLSLSVAVYVGDELAAVAEPIMVDNEPLYFLTIQSDKVGALRFELNGQRLNVQINDQMVNGQMVNIPDSHHGSLKAPVLLKPADDNRPYKIIENDHVVIIRNSEKYDVTGKKL